LTLFTLVTVRYSADEAFTAVDAAAATSIPAIAAAAATASAASAAAAAAAKTVAADHDDGDDTHFFSTLKCSEMSMLIIRRSAGESPDQDRIYSDGWSYLQSSFPLLSYITGVTLVH
jgi:hypothetical protein